jgi:hypothetical protein
MFEYSLLAYGVACRKWKMFADDLIALRAKLNGSRATTMAASLNCERGCDRLTP